MTHPLPDFKDLKTRLVNGLLDYQKFYKENCPHTIFARNYEAYQNEEGTYILKNNRIITSNSFPLSAHQKMLFEIHILNLAKAIVDTETLLARIPALEPVLNVLQIRFDTHKDNTRTLRIESASMCPLESSKGRTACTSSFQEQADMMFDIIEDAYVKSIDWDPETFKNWCINDTTIRISAITRHVRAPTAQDALDVDVWNCWSTFPPENWTRSVSSYPYGPSVQRLSKTVCDPSFETR
jgi:hypothetical protein